MSNTVVPVRVSGFGPTPIDMDVPVDLLAPLGRFARGDDVDRRGPAPPRRSRQPGPDGRITALRGTVAGPDRPGPVELFAPALVADDRAATTHGFPFAAVATSGLTAGVAALFFSPVFALFAVVSSLAIVGRWAGAWLARRRRDRRRTEALERAAATWSDTTDRWADAEVRARRAGAPSPAALFALVSGDRSPWSERLDPGADVELVLGRGRAVVDVDVDVADPARGTIDPRSVGLPTGIELVDVPVVAASGDGGGLAVCGDRADVLASARWLVASTAARYGPVDLGIVVVTMADRAVDWDWVKWLPSLRRCHVVDVDGGRQGRQEQWLHRLGDAGPALVVVDGVEPVGASPLARLLAGRIEHSALLWLGDPGEVPGGCRARLDVRADGSGVMRRPDEVRPLQWYGLDADGVDRVARWLAPFDDPEVRDDGGRLPRSVSIDELLSIDLPAIDGGDVDLDETVRRAWERATPRSLAAPIGVGQDGPESVDLVADGPHALVAGTTGAGKSELLRTLVVGIAALHPPALASFVLVDFKGGGAFDVVADLPHVAAVVTDLDRAEAARALRGLRAELVDREERLREMGCSDVADVDPTHPSSFGRLLVVVDEFAALADELPDFLDGLVDIARRGRSLGVHLVLATQRPSGVVTGQIRSNTNLRICLRVQDRADSMDVIDRPDAADLPPAPGRAFVQRGGQACAPVQVATIAGVSDLATVDRFVVHPALLGLSLPLGHIAHWFEQGERAVDGSGRLDGRTGGRPDQPAGGGAGCGAGGPPLASIADCRPIPGVGRLVGRPPRRRRHPARPGRRRWARRPGCSGRPRSAAHRPLVVASRTRGCAHRRCR
jgi:S-DNA-T family DNA segregation ATPase FtsK/SpoIIIE